MCPPDPAAEDKVQHVVRSGMGSPAHTSADTARPHLLFAGAGSASGSALLAQMLASRRYAQVTVLTHRKFLRLPRTMADCVAHVPAAPMPKDAGIAVPAADAAVLHFGVARYAREAIFWNPQRTDLLPLAAALRRRGVRALQLVLPAATDKRHAGPACGPLTPGERRSLQQLGFEQLTVSEPAPHLMASTTAASPLERLAAWMIGALVQVLQARPTPAHARRRPRR